MIRVLLLLLLVYSSNLMAQTINAHSFYVGAIDSSYTYEMIIEKYGKPLEDEVKSYGRVLRYYPVSYDEFYYGYLWITLNNNNRVHNLIIGGCKNEGYKGYASKTFKYFKEKFGVSDEMISLFNTPFKELNKQLARNGFILSKPDKSIYDHETYTLTHSKHELHAGVILKIDIGVGKSLDEDRRGKLYTINITYPN